MNHFDEKEHNNELFKIEFAINEAKDLIDLNDIPDNIKNYKNKYKLLHFSWSINENVTDLKLKLEKKINEINMYETTR